MASWLNLFKTQVFSKKMLIVHGNVEDFFLYEKNGLSANLLCIDLLKEELKAVGFSEFIVWDRISNMQTDNIDVNEILSNQEKNDGEKIISLGSLSNSNNNEQHKTQKIEPSEFWVATANQMQKSEKPIAIIANYASFALPNETMLSFEEKKDLLQIRKIITESPYTEDDYIGKPRPVLVLVTNNLTQLPISIYQNHPSVHEIVIPKPSREERKKFIDKTITKWQLSPQIRANEVLTEEFIDYLEGFTIRDLMQMQELSCSVQGRNENNDFLTTKELITRYKYGEKTSPWESLNKENVKNLELNLKKRVKGQDEAVKRVSQMVLRAFTGFSGIQHSASKQTPKGTLFFVGPTGVGKTELAKALATNLFGDEDACIRFDMSEYNHEHSDQRLVGAPPGYVGYEAGGQLTNAIKMRPFSVILFDEIEKAHGRILDKFLQILEDGRLTDGRGETVSFSDAVIIFTSNIGASTVLASDNSDNEFMQAVENHFKVTLGRPELLNRIGNNVIPFKHLTDNSVLINIIKSKLIPMEKFLKTKYKVSRLDIDEGIFNHFVKDFSKDTGGRGVLNHIVDVLIDPLSQKFFDSESSNYKDKVVKITYTNEIIINFE